MRRSLKCSTHEKIFKMLNKNNASLRGVRAMSSQNEFQSITMRKSIIRWVHVQEDIKNTKWHV